MNKTVTINRLTTGVPGLDDVLGGGLPEFSFNLIAGPPGSSNLFYGAGRTAAEDVALPTAI